MTNGAFKIIGWVLSILFGIFMIGASVAPKLLGNPVAQETMVGLGWDDSPLVLIGVLELLCTLLYLLPATGLLGASLMMAILGGAMATHIRAHSPLPLYTLFPIYLGIVMWAGLWLRDWRVRGVWPLRRTE